MAVRNDIDLGIPRAEPEGRPEPDEVDLHAETREEHDRREVSLEKRRGNEILVERARQHDLRGAIDFLCECGSPGHRARVQLTADDYERLSRFGFVGGDTCAAEPRLLRAS